MGAKGLEGRQYPKCNGKQESPDGTNRDYAP